MGLSAKTPMTMKQELFCQNIFKGMSQRDAYKESYNTEHTTDKSIDELSCRLASEIKIKSRIEQLKQKLENKTIVTVDYVLKGIKEIAEKNEARDNDKLKAYELLGKYKAMFTDKTELSGGEELIIKILKE